MYYNVNWIEEHEGEHPEDLAVSDEPDDTDARRTRAERLQAHIDRLVAPEGDAHPAPPSPREFIHRKMAEREQQEGTQ